MRARGRGEGAAAGGQTQNVVDESHDDPDPIVGIDLKSNARGWGVREVVGILARDLLTTARQEGLVVFVDSVRDAIVARTTARQEGLVEDSWLRIVLLYKRIDDFGLLVELGSRFGVEMLALSLNWVAWLEDSLRAAGGVRASGDVVPPTNGTIFSPNGESRRGHDHVYVVRM